MTMTAHGLRVAIAQTPMQWTTEANTAVIEAAMQLASDRGAAICVFSELAVTGFHRQIRIEAVPEKVEPAIARIRAKCKALALACAVGAPTFAAAGGAIYNSYLHIDENGEIAGQVDKTGQTPAEATFFHGGRGRPVSTLRGLKTSAVLCREVFDLTLVRDHLPSGAAELVFWPGAMGRAPENRGDDWVDPVPLAQQLARQSKAYVVQNNWPNALNNPPDSPDSEHLGGSKVFAPDGRLLLTLPMHTAGVASFELGAREFVWDALPDPSVPA
jgi:predicted amidohydrolase